LADAHVDHDLLELRQAQRVGPAEPLAERRDDFLPVPLVEARHDRNHFPRWPGRGGLLLLPAALFTAGFLPATLLLLGVALFLFALAALLLLGVGVLLRGVALGLGCAV